MWRLYRIQYNEVFSNYQTELETSVNITELFIRQKIESFSSKLKLVSTRSEVRAFTKSPNNSMAIKDVQLAFLEIAEDISELTQIRILDTNGKELIRINRNGEKPEIVAYESLQDKSERYYFEDALTLNPHQIYISDFDLNIENNQVEVPYKPTIRFAIKLFDENNSLFGLLIINVDGYDFFKTIGEYELTNSEYKEIGLLDSNNYWSLSNRSHNNLNDMIFDMQSNIENELIDRINKLENGNFEKDQKHYTFTKIKLYNNSKYFIEDGKNFWYIVGHFDLHLLTQDKQFLLKNFRVFTFLLCFIGALLSYIVMILMQIKSNNSLLLMVSSYISDSSQEGILILNQSRHVVYCNQVFEEIFSYTKNGIINKRIDEIFDGQLKDYDNIGKSNIVWKGNVWNKGMYGNIICKTLTIKVIFDPHKKPVYFICIYSNPDSFFSSYKIDQVNENSFLISKDEIDIISRNIMTNNPSTDQNAILSLQLSGSLRKLFETNQLLHGKFISHSNKEFESNDDIGIVAVPRTDIIILSIKGISNGGIMDYPIDESTIREFVKKLEFGFRRVQMQLELDQLEVAFNIGVAICKEHGESIQEVVKNSLVALEVLTKFKNSNMLIYNEAYYDFIREDLIIRDGIRQAFKNSELFLEYQPQFRVADNTIYGVEALIRWYSDVLGEVKPDRFIPILEETEDIFKLGIYVIDLIIEDLCTPGLTYNNMRVSLNLSSKEFLDDKIISYLLRKKEKLIEHNIRLCVEITETTLIKNFEKAKEQIQLLQNNSVEIAIDDFGTGYSSLSYLKNFYSDELKIDRMFIKDYPLNDDGKLVKAIISIGKQMNMSLVLEGVETLEQLELVKNSGCDSYQGYFGARPQKIEDLKILLRESGIIDFRSDDND